LAFKEPEQPALKPELRFEKVVFLYPYKLSEMTKRLQAAFYEINLKAAQIKMGEITMLRNRKLTEAERKDSALDFLSGFEIIDSR